MRFSRVFMCVAAVCFAACGGNPPAGNDAGQGGGSGEDPCGLLGTCCDGHLPGHDFNNENANCGGCGRACLATTHCSNGICVPGDDGGIGGGAAGGGSVAGGGSAGGGSAGGGSAGGGAVTGGGSDVGGGSAGGGTVTGGGSAGGGTVTGGGSAGGGTVTGGGSAGGGTASCTDLCSDGTSICDGLGFRTCTLNTTSGCRQFGAITTCTNGLICTAGSCMASCTDQCTLGAKQCSSSGGVVSCNRQNSGCTEWVVDRSCQTNEVCSGGQCVPRNSCTNQCTLAATRCTPGAQKQTCVQQPNGCTDWSLPQACTSGQSCVSPATVCAAVSTCTAGATRCAAQTSNIETCDQQGNWIVTQNCPQACAIVTPDGGVAGAVCTAATACSVGAARCNGANVELCNSTGTAWLYNQTCNTTCTSGVCGDPCTTGAKRCNGNVPETCNGAGTGWTASQTCSTSCYLGDCAQADLLVDGTTVTLEGDLKYQNGVIVRNGGSIRVGPTGILKIHAGTINIDAASNINANDVGDDTRCEGSAAFMSSAYCSYYGRTQATTYAAPSCYGTAVPASSCTFNSYCGGYACSAPASTPYDRDDDISISEGSKYGASKGGGLVRLVADTVTIAGQITANASAGSASGGGVLIAANNITLTGPIQTAGANSGGVGRVKTLRGAMSSISGTVTGTRSDSVMPPLELVSGSHPIPGFWYNDGLGDLFMAWNKPFPSANGYYVVATQSSNRVPSPANATFVAGESKVIPAAALLQGTNYFHIVTVDSAVNIGTVKNTFMVNVNTQPVTLASSSHPVQTTWYSANNSIFINWTNPQADSNYTGYYYVFDHFADTVPNPATATLTPNKQVLLANTADGLWYFHLVSRDTRGAVTKAAAHYNVRIGVEPAKSNLSGSVFDASNANAPLSGVTIKINRGVFSTTTNAGTYTFNNNLYVGPWEVTASKTGYVSQTVMINLTAGNPVNQNFSLVAATP